MSETLLRAETWACGNCGCPVWVEISKNPEEETIVSYYSMGDHDDTQPMLVCPSCGTKLNYFELEY